MSLIKLALTEKSKETEEVKETPNEEVGEKQLPKEEVADQEDAELNSPKIDNTPVTGNKTNESVDPSFTPGGLKAQDFKDAISEAIEVGQSDKVMPFVKQVLEKYPDTANEVIKMVKIQLHDSIMKKLIQQEEAIKITDELNGMVGGV